MAHLDYDNNTITYISSRAGSSRVLAVGEPPRLSCLHVLPGYYLAANLLGIALATAWSFAANSFWTWGGVQ